MSDTPKFCSQCGKAVQPGAKFCTECGQPFAVDPPPTAVATPAKPTNQESAPKKAKSVPAAAPPAAVPPLRLRGGWMMLIASLFAFAAAYWHQTTILLWELGIGGPILLVTAVFMLRLRGGWRWFAALLAAAPAAWGLWQLHTYLPIFPDFMPQSWPVICLLPIACILPILAALRAWRSLISPPYRIVAGQPPRRRRAIGGSVFATAVVAGIVCIAFLPEDVRKPLLEPLRPRHDDMTAQLVPDESSQSTSSDMSVNPVLPPMNSSDPTTSDVRPVPTRATPNMPRDVVVSPTFEAYHPRKPQEPRAYPNLAADLAATAAVREVTADRTAGRTSFVIQNDYTILQRQLNPDGTESLRVRAASTSTDSQGRTAKGTVLLDVVADAAGKVLSSRVTEMMDAETASLLSTP